MQPGDTIYSIARRHGLTTREFISLNPGITERGLSVGEKVRLPSPQGRNTIETVGYVYPNIDQAYLSEIYPYFTYLSIVGNRITQSGFLIGVNNKELIEASRQANVAPMMVVSNTTDSGLYSSALAHSVLINPSARERLISNIITAVEENNYYGALIDFEFISPENFSAYINFLLDLKDALHAQNDTMFLVIRIATILSEQATIAQLLPFGEYENLADRFIIRTNEWACNVNLEAPLVDLAQQALDFATDLVSADRLIVGIPNCCFHTQLPVQPQTMPTLLSIIEAERLAFESGASFQLDTRSGASYFRYFDDAGKENIVWCPNRCTSQSILELVRIYGLGGVSFRMVDDFPITDYQALGAIFNIQKVL